MSDPKILFVRLPADLHRELKIAAAKRGRPMAHLVIDAVVQYLEQTKEVSNG